ncbi:hypothetical protein C1D09_032420 [Mesorhizobium intechi]|uniref:Peptidase C51 domain-containing protein n=1 Tax=Mesorhizobium intechi TaxID=537601 RepID=A0A8T9AHT5_9HYPH|nr:hypothetical protein [Mesorhizobium intechi]TSE00213.1 hypothetical protein C1D09_032420 [Mesorhizobium intechi]
MFQEVLQTVFMKQEPSVDSDDGPMVVNGEIGTQIAASPDNQWVQLSVLSQLLVPRLGWMKLVNGDGTPLLKEAEAPPRIEFGVWSFINACIDAEFWINGQGKNSPFFVAADYLIAWVLIETKNKLGNIGPKTPPGDGTGPFQLTTTEWATFLADPIAADYSAASRDIGLDQIAGAAFLARKAMSDMSAAITQNDAAAGIRDTQTVAGPYIPAYIDVLLVHMFGLPTATSFRTLKLAGQGGTAVDAVLRQSFSDADVQAYLKTRDNVLKDWDSGVIETVDGAIVNVQNLLGAAFAKAFALIQQQAPEDLPKADGVASWFAVADAERVAWEPLGDETTPAAQTRIRGYFQSIGQPLRDGAAIPPWCGAFAGFCVKTASPVLLKTIRGNPLSAGSWQSFGNESIQLGDPNPPRGAIVVLSPDKNSSSASHVGFFSRYLGSDNAQVELLGGNQSDRVTLTKFDRSKIIVIRWQSAQKAADNNASDAAMGAADAGQFNTLLDFIGQFESGDNYNAYFAHSRNTNNPALVSMTLRDILIFQDQLVAQNRISSACGKYQIVRNTLKGLITNGAIGPADIFSSGNQDRLAIALMKQRGLGAFLSGNMSEDQFALNLAKEWASMPVPIATKGQFRNVKAGESYYASDGVNKALTTVEKFRAAVRSAQK